MRKILTRGVLSPRLQLSMSMSSYNMHRNEMQYENLNQEKPPFVHGVYEECKMSVVGDDGWLKLFPSSLFPHLIFTTSLL